MKDVTKIKHAGMLRVFVVAALVLLFAAAGVGAVSADDFFFEEIVVKEAPIIEDVPELVLSIDDDGVVMDGDVVLPGSAVLSSVLHEDVAAGNAVFVNRAVEGDLASGRSIITGGAEQTSVRAVRAVQEHVRDDMVIDQIGS